MASYTTPDPGLLAELLLLIVVPQIVSDPPMNCTPPPGTLSGSASTRRRGCR